MAASMKVMPKSRLFCLTQRCLLSRLLSTEAVVPAQASAVRQRKDEIVIPRKKIRNSLSILKELAATVKDDPTGPHYKYVDDPWMIPTTPLQKRTYALSRASGVKAARWFVSNYTRQFEHDQAEPKVKAYDPSQYKTPRIAVAGEEGLAERIELSMPAEAYAMYSELKTQDRLSEVSESCRTSLLTLLSWCGGSRGPSTEEYTEQELFFKRDLGHDSSGRSLNKTWSTDDPHPAEVVFADLEDKTAEAYGVLIRGMAKHLESDRPFVLVEEMKEKGLEVPLEVWNSLVSVAALTKDSAELKIEAIQGVLKDMAHAGVSPDLATFNNALASACRLVRHRNTGAFIQALMQEMKKCHIEPSLATWAHLVHFYYFFDNSESNALYEIMKQIEGKEFTLRDSRDVGFFSMAMIKCCANLRDLELGWRLHKLLMTGSNRALLGDAYQEMVYFNFFFRLLCTFDTLDNIFKVYEEFAPHAWVPSWNSLGELLEAVELQEGYERLPQIWSDLVLFDFWKQEVLTSQLLKLMVKKKQNEILQQQYAAMVESLLLKVQDDADRGMIRTLQLTGSMLGDMLVLRLRAGLLPEAWELFELYFDKKKGMGGPPSEASLLELGTACVGQSDIDKSLDVVRAMSELGYSRTGVLVDLAMEKLELSNSQRAEVEMMR